MRKPCSPTHFLSADWSKDARKRSVHVADVCERRIHRLECEDWTLEKLLGSAHECSPGPVLVGMDAAIGLPLGFWRALPESGRHPASFIEWLGERDSESDFFAPVSSPSEWSVSRPFFRVPKGEGALKSFEERLPHGFYRKVDRRANAKSPFAVSGIPGVVGWSTLTLWQELAGLLRAEDRDFAVWPFEGEDLGELLHDRRIVLAEIYPALAYGVALADELPARRMRLKKTDEAQRRTACSTIAQALWVKRGGVDLGPSGPAQANDDAFDSYMTAAAVLRCILDDSDLAAPDVDPVAEGGMLLAGSVDLNLADGTRRLAVGGKEESMNERISKQQLLSRISIDKDICFGKPCIRGHRIWVSLVLDLLASGWTVQELLEQYPGIEERDVLACLAYGAEMSRERYVDVPLDESV